MGQLLIIFTLFILTSMVCVQSKGDASYESIDALQQTILISSSYSTTLRPIRNQTHVLRVAVSFSLVAIVAVDDVKQEMVTNGFLFLIWKDERSGWNPDDYGGVNRLTPEPNQIWHPRLLLINTLEERDPFEDDYSHLSHLHNGMVGWIPGGLFHTYCALNMEKYPFDVQHCYIQLCPMSHTNTSIQFIPQKEMNMGFYFPNPGWDLLHTNVTVENISVVPGETLSCPTFNFELKRRPTTVILNVIFPIIFLSGLNSLVFAIPVDSGEKIGYAVTVLLSLSVFLSMVSTMTPQVSDVVPALTIYLFVLLLCSVLTVAAAILTIFLYHQDQKEEERIQSNENLKRAFKKLLKNLETVSPQLTNNNNIGISTKVYPTDTDIDYNCNQGYEPAQKRHNRYRLISRHINKFFFVLTTVLWVIMTVWFFTFTCS